MKKIKWMFVMGLILLSVSVASSTTINNGTYFNGDGTPNYPNLGYMWCDVFTQSTTENSYSEVYHTGGHVVTSTRNGYGKGQVGVEGSDKCQGAWYYDTSDSYTTHYFTSTTSTYFYCKMNTRSESNDIQIRSRVWIGEYPPEPTKAYVYNKVIIAPNIYSISGNTACVDNVSLYLEDNTFINTTILNNENDSYNFQDLINDFSYKLKFSNGKEYDFICTGNMVYNYDGCSYTTINIQDECANLLHNQFSWIDDNGNIVYSGHDNPIKVQGVDENDKLIVMWTTWLGALQKTCYAQFDHDINLYDPFLYWDMEVYVYDNESNPLSGANVDFNQDCVINGYPARNKFTGSDGMASFTQCENKGANLVVSKDGYKTLSTSVSGGWYDVYTPTYQVSVTLQSSDSDNSSTWDIINNSINDTNANETPYDIPDANGTPNDIHIYFRNMNGDYVNQINDTDNYTRCYYSVNTLDDVSMTLVFQKSFTGYYFYDVDTYSYLIDNNSYGYFEIPNSYFNNSDYSYRAYIYDYAYPFDDRYAYLNVVNQTEPYYDNLTGYCMFMNTNKNGSIDYREDITCYTMIVSDNASLRTVSLELYDNSTLIDYKNLTWVDFTDDDIYGWYLGYNYTLGHNYSLVLRGYDGTILDCDNVIAKNIVGNKLTIKVTDSFNHPLSNVYVFCEHYGSINTGYLNYGTFEGLPDGETRYKASKSGYRSGLWSTVNLTDENEIVSYQLIQEKQEGSVAMVRLSDDDAKNLYYPLMYFLLTLMLLGALINVIK